jgi:acetyl-CoA C-acetyltransferase
MSIRGKAVIVGAYEHPRREIPDRTTAQIHHEVAVGALADAGLTLADVDAYFCDSTAPGFGPVSMAEYLGLAARYVDSTETGGSSSLAHVGHAAAAIAAGKCRVALITLAGKPRSGGSRPRGCP